MASPRKRRTVPSDPKIFLIEPEAFYPIEVIAEKCRWINSRTVADHLFKNGLKRVKMGNYVAVYGQDLLDYMMSIRQ
jgi:hypothetical protein